MVITMPGAIINDQGHPCLLDSRDNYTKREREPASRSDRSASRVAADRITERTRRDNDKGTRPSPGMLSASSMNTDTPNPGSSE